MNTLELVEEFLRRNTADAKVFADEKRHENPYFNSLLNVRASVLAAFQEIQDEELERHDRLLAASAKLIEVYKSVFAKAFAYDLANSLREEEVLKKAVQLQEVDHVLETLAK